MDRFRLYFSFNILAQKPTKMNAPICAQYVMDWKSMWSVLYLFQPAILQLVISVYLEKKTEL